MSLSSGEGGGKRAEADLAPDLSEVCSLCSENIADLCLSHALLCLYELCVELCELSLVGGDELRQQGGVRGDERW